MPIINIHVDHLYIEDVEKLGPLISVLYSGHVLTHSGYGSSRTFFLSDNMNRFSIDEPSDDQLHLMSEAEWDRIQESKRQTEKEADSSSQEDQTAQ